MAMKKSREERDVWDEGADRWEDEERRDHWDEGRREWRKQDTWVSDEKEPEKLKVKIIKKYYLIKIERKIASLIGLFCKIKKISF